MLAINQGCTESALVNDSSFSNTDENQSENLDDDDFYEDVIHVEDEITGELTVYTVTPAYDAIDSDFEDPDGPVHEIVIYGSDSVSHPNNDNGRDYYCWKDPDDVCYTNESPVFVVEES